MSAVFPLLNLIGGGGGGGYILMMSIKQVYILGLSLASLKWNVFIFVCKEKSTQLPPPPPPQQQQQPKSNNIVYEYDSFDPQILHYSTWLVACFQVAVNAGQPPAAPAAPLTRTVSPLCT